jgi:hypothetical protein
MISLRTVAQEMGLGSSVNARIMAQKTNTASPVSLNKLVASHYIDQKYNQVGGLLSPLGSTMTEVTGQTTNYLRTYRGGNIQYSSAQGAVGIVRNEITIRYIGFQCIKRVDDGDTGPSNEPYIIVGVYPPSVLESISTKKIPDNDGTDNYGNIDGGDSKTDPIDLWTRRPPEDLVIACVVMEHDSGDSQKIKDEVQKALKKGIDAAAAAAGVPVPDDWVNYGTVFLAGLVTDDLLGLGDDVIGSSSFILKYEDMINHPQMQKFPGDDNNEYNLEVKIQENDAEYRLYFQYFNEQVTRQI